MHRTSSGKTVHASHSAGKPVQFLRGYPGPTPVDCAAGKLVATLVGAADVRQGLRCPGLPGLSQVHTNLILNEIKAAPVLPI